MALTLFTYDKLADCAALDAWLKHPKELPVAPAFQSLPGGVGASDSVPLKLATAAVLPDARFQLKVAQSKRMYASITVRYGSSWKEFLLLECHHPNDGGKDYNDGLCNTLVEHGKPCEKRFHSLPNRWTRRTFGNLRPPTLQDFYAEAAKHLRVKLPLPPLAIVQRPSATLGLMGA